MKKLCSLLFVCMIALPGATALAANSNVEIRTNQGVIVAELYSDKAPKTVENFLQYVKDGFYNGTIFHRVIDNFMIQGGGFTADMKQKATRAAIQNEANNGLRNDFGTLAMARTPDPNSASAQFFINLKDNDFLNFREPSFQGFGYCVFGKVTKGFEIVQKIAKVPTANAGMFQNVPIAAVVIESIKLLPETK
jgi:cyclophilin family peptidyl-prolyl cis-trans isomerase